MIVNHYGRMVDSEVPITGVFNTNRLENIDDDLINADDPDYESEKAEWEEEHKGTESEEYGNNDEWTQSTAFIGMQRQAVMEGLKADGKEIWDADPDAEYSAIVSLGGPMYITQVIKSVWVIRCALGSPCIPGQGDADTPGVFLAYSVPPDVAGSEYEGRIFKL